MRGEELPVDPNEACTVRGSPLASFAVAFAFIFGGGIILFFLPLYWLGFKFLQGEGVYVVGTGYAAFSVLLAWFASFQVCTSITLSARGILGRWRGPFGGHSSLELPWSNLEKIDVLRFGWTCSLSNRASAWGWLYVTYAQARAILSHPMCPRGAATPEVAKRIGVASRT
jgi:hypothetical protein